MTINYLSWLCARVSAECSHGPPLLSSHNGFTGALERVVLEVMGKFWRARLGFMGYSFCLTDQENTEGSFGVLELRFQAGIPSEIQDNVRRTGREKKEICWSCGSFLNEERPHFCHKMLWILLNTADAPDQSNAGLILWLPPCRGLTWKNRGR